MTEAALEPIASGTPLAHIPAALIERARNAMHAKNLELLDETIEEIVEAAGRPLEDASSDTNVLRARFQRLMLNFPDQGYDWRTPVTALVNEIPALLDEIDRLRSQTGDRRAVIDTEAGLKELPVGAVIRSIRPDRSGGVWSITSDIIDDTDFRYMGAGITDFRTAGILLKVHGPFEVLAA